jgi:SAM-dependent methyltransferase
MHLILVHHSFLSRERMQSHPADVTFRIPIEGELYQQIQAVHSPDITSEIRSKVSFFTGDACQMEHMIEDGLLLKSYDGILLSNLLCHLPDPIACLNCLSLLVNPNGIVVMTTPFSWLPE